MDTTTRPINKIPIRPTSGRKIRRLKIKGYKKILCKWKWKEKAGVVIFISDKTDFKTRAVTRDKWHLTRKNGLK